MKRFTLALLFFAACASTPQIVKIVSGPAPAEKQCDIADECCEVEGETWCCFDNGKRIRCWKGTGLPPDEFTNR